MNRRNKSIQCNHKQPYMEKAKLLKTRGDIMTQKTINKVIGAFKASNKSLEDVCKCFNLTSNEVDYLYYIVAKTTFVESSKRHGNLSLCQENKFIII